MDYDRVIQFKECEECFYKDECDKFQNSKDGRMLHIEINGAFAPMLALKMGQNDRKGFQKWVKAKAKELDVDPKLLTIEIILALRMLSKNVAIRN